MYLFIFILNKQIQYHLRNYMRALMPCLGCFEHKNER